MIYQVTEWIENACQTFLFDGSKARSTEPFEVAYLSLCQKAVRCPEKTLYVNHVTNLLDSVRQRFGTYQNGERCWTRLHARPPCQVDDSVVLVFDE